jgi:hypothetical protein
LGVLFEYLKMHGTTNPKFSAVAEKYSRILGYNNQLNRIRLDGLIYSLKVPYN